MNILEVQNLCKTYGKGEAAVQALRDVTFSVHKGEFVAIVGESGSGKSTLLNVVGALDNPTAGKVLIDGKDIFSMPEKKLTVFRRQHIGFIFQSFNLIPELNVEQNITFPLLLDYKKPDQKFVNELLQVLGLTERRNHLPSQLSGGQQQRVAIGRALVTHPALIMADEPTGNLDSKNSQEVIALLQSMSQKYQQTILMITHNENQAGAADRVFRMSDGVFSEDYDRLVTNAGIEGVSEAAVQFILDASNPNNAGTGLGYLQSSFQSGISVASVAPATRVLYNPQMKSSYNFVPGIMGLIFILICAMMTSVSIVREKETGTMEVLLVSPVRPIWIIFAKMIPYFLLSCVNLVVILVLARYVLGVPMSGSMVGLVGLSLLYLVLSLALGLFISTMANTQVTAMLISGMVLMLPIIMLSGMLFPVENMPGILQALSCIVPARWYIDAVRKLMIGGMPFAEVWQQACILFAMTAVLVGVALKKFNDKLE